MCVFFNFSSFTCEDKNECLTSPCEGECINTPGSFQCICNPGYEIVNRSKCRDVDECEDMQKSGCKYSCTNTPGRCVIYFSTSVLSSSIVYARLLIRNMVHGLFDDIGSLYIFRTCTYSSLSLWYLLASFSINFTLSAKPWRRTWQV